MDDTQQAAAQPVDPDVDVAAERSRGGGERAVVAVIAAGGVIGAVIDVLTRRRLLRPGNAVPA